MMEQTAPADGPEAEEIGSCEEGPQLWINLRDIGARRRPLLAGGANDSGGDEAPARDRRDLRDVVKPTVHSESE